MGQIRMDGDLAVSGPLLGKGDQFFDQIIEPATLDLGVGFSGKAEQLMGDPSLYALTTLDRFDHGSLAIEQATCPVPYVITYEVAMEIVKTMKAGPFSFSPDVRLCGPA
ncbi:MAG: hypothetical protein ACLFUL_13680 [Desulfobacteraceae bacterium]